MRICLRAGAWQGHGFRLEDEFAALPQDRARALGRPFWAGHRRPMPQRQGRHPADLSTGGPDALLLTQPLEDIDLCSAAEKRALYAALVTALWRGHRVHVKPHPRERVVPARHPHPAGRSADRGIAAGLGAALDLAVALCSASLEVGTASFIRRRYSVSLWRRISSSPPLCRPHPRACHGGWNNGSLRGGKGAPYRCESPAFRTPRGLNWHAARGTQVTEPTERV